MATSVYDELGGFFAVRKIIIEFYNRVLDDPLLMDVFKGVDMDRVIDHQTKFFAMLLGGPDSYTDEEIKRIHIRLNLDHQNFDQTKKHLSETLYHFDLSDDHVNYVVNEFEIRRKFIVLDN